MKKFLVATLAAAMLSASALGVAACSKDKNATPEEPALAPAPTSKEFTVTFDANGGTWPSAVTTPVTLKTNKDTGKLAALPATNPERENFSFDGWTVTKDGTDTVTVAKVYTKNTTVYAKWKSASGVEDPDDPDNPDNPDNPDDPDDPDDPVATETGNDIYVGDTIVANFVRNDGKWADYQAALAGGQDWGLDGAWMILDVLITGNEVFHVTATIEGGESVDITSGVDTSGAKYKGLVEIAEGGAISFKEAGTYNIYIEHYKSMDPGHWNVAVEKDGSSSDDPVTPGDNTVVDFSTETSGIYLVGEGIGGGWTSGILMNENPNDTNEHMLQHVYCVAGKWIKVRTSGNSADNNAVGYLDNYSKGIADEVDGDGGKEIQVKEDGYYDFYFKGTYTYVGKSE